MELICSKRLLKNIIYLRKQSNTPLKAIARHIGVDVRQYQNIESGKTRLDIDRLNTIAKFYDKNPVELLTEDLDPQVIGLHNQLDAKKEGAEIYREGEGDTL